MLLINIWWQEQEEEIHDKCLKCKKCNAAKNGELTRREEIMVKEN